MARAVARRPDLWPTALRAGRALIPPRWWGRRPFLPLPDRDWVRFRLVTAYGGTGEPGDAPFEAADVITWLEWRRDFPG